jgi:hypothetical protein
MSDEDKIGYGRPPRHTRFRKGRSGNPKGRPKGVKNLKTDLLEELAEPISIRDQGRSRSFSKQRALIKSLIARALQGNMAAFAQLVTLMMRVIGPEAVPDSQEEPLTPEEQEVLRLALARLGSGPDKPEGDGWPA